MSTDKLYLGYHVSSAGGYMAMGKRAAALGANTFAFFTRNPRGGAAAKAEPSDAAAFRAWASEQGFGPLVAHSPYTLNPCSDKPSVRDFAKRAFTEDLERMELTPGCFYNLQPGSLGAQGLDGGLALRPARRNAVPPPQMHTTVLLETMAGKGSEVGGRFEELREIIDRVEQKDKLGVCLDTWLVWDGGYEIVSDPDAVLTEFDRVIGLDRLKAVHLNNSLNALGSHKDRHAKIREGVLPEEALARIVCHPALAGRPFILETPNDDAGYAAEIRWLREKWEEDHGKN